MKITGIEIENFRAFHGKHEILFSTDEKKPVTVIVAQNNVGKSSILEAIYWCLYGEMPIDADKTDDKINNQSEEIDEAAQAKVKLKLIEGSDDFVISRTLPSENSESIFSALKYVSKDHSWDEEEPRALVNRLLPKNLRDFFLFRGEGVEDLFHKNEQRLKNSMEHIQGLTYLEEGRKDLENFYISLLAKREKLSKKMKKEEVDRNNLSELNQAVEVLEKRLAKNNQDIKETEKSINQFNTLINDSGVEAIAQKNKENIRLQTKLKIEILPNIEKLNKEKIKLISERGFRVLGYSYKEKIDTFLAAQRAKGKFPADYSEAFLKSLLDSENCICGEKLDDAKKEHLKSSLGEGLSTEQDRITRDIGAELGAFEIANKDYQKDIHRINTQLQELNITKDQFENDIKENTAFIKDHANFNNKDVAKWEKSKDAEEVVLKNLLVESGTLGNKLDAAKAEFEKEKRLAEKSGSANLDSSLDAKINFIDEASQLLLSSLDKSREEIRNGLLKTLQELTKKYSTLGETFIYKDDESFNPLLVEKGQNIERVLNKGDLTMKGIYFACAAIMQNMSRRKNPEHLISEGTSAPMIVDAPFSNLDQNNLTSATKMIIDSCEQSVILVNYKDYKNFIEVVKKSKKLGKHYFIQRSVKEKKAGSEVDLNMTIEGKTVVSHLLGQDFTTSSIYEVKI